MRYVLTSALAAVAIGASLFAAADTASGSVAFKSKTRDFTLAITNGYLVQGPDDMDPTTTIHRVILSTKDLRSTIMGCDEMSCVTSDLNEGMTVDFGGSSRLNYWLVLNGQLVQYSGTTTRASFKATTNTPAHLAGTLTFDDAAAGGAKVNVTFDLTVTKTFSK
jgi:hypothetical protein